MTIVRRCSRKFAVIRGFVEDAMTDKEYYKLCDDWEEIMLDLVPAYERKIRNFKGSPTELSSYEKKIESLKTDADEIQKQIRAEIEVMKKARAEYEEKWLAQYA